MWTIENIKSKLGNHWKKRWVRYPIIFIGLLTILDDIVILSIIIYLFITGQIK